MTCLVCHAPMLLLMEWECGCAYEECLLCGWTFDLEAHPDETAGVFSRGYYRPRAGEVSD